MILVLKAFGIIG